MSFVAKVLLAGGRTIIVAFAVVGALAGVSDGSSQSTARIEIRTQSSRADLASGGDALVEVKAPAGTSLNQLTLTLNGKGTCNTLYPVHSEPRLVAGAPLSNDVFKCRLKPFNYADYNVTFTDAQKARLAAIFPSGVCDFSKPGVEQGPIKGMYQRY